MKDIAWDGSLAVGIELIDGQHQELFAKLTAMSKAIREGEGEREIQRTLEFLIAYTKYHFGAEEKLMADSGYPDLAAHRGIHAEFIRTLERLEEEYREEGSTKILAGSLNTLLSNWLVGHIETVDRKFAAFARLKPG